MKILTLVCCEFCMENPSRMCNFGGEIPLRRIDFSRHTWSLFFSCCVETALFGWLQLLLFDMAIFYEEVTYVDRDGRNCTP
jgi:hypothetical protein